MKIKLQILLFILLSANVVFSQKKATVKLKDGRSLSGYCKLSPNQVKFKSSKKGKYKKLIVENVNYVVVQESKKKKISYAFRSIKEGSKPRLLELVYNGSNIKLLKSSFTVPLGGASNSKSNGRVTTTTSVGLSPKLTSFYVIKKGDTHATVLSSSSSILKSFKTRAREYFQDCENLVPLIGKKGYTKKHIKNVVKYYQENCSITSEQDNDIANVESDGKNVVEEIQNSDEELSKETTQTNTREAKKKALEDKRKKILEERAIAKQKRLEEAKIRQTNLKDEKNISLEQKKKKILEERAQNEQKKLATEKKGTIDTKKKALEGKKKKILEERAKVRQKKLEERKKNN